MHWVNVVLIIIIIIYGLIIIRKFVYILEVSGVEIYLKHYKACECIV